MSDQGVKHLLVGINYTVSFKNYRNYDCEFNIDNR